MANHHDRESFKSRHVPLIKRISKVRHVEWRPKHIMNSAFLTVLALIISLHIWKILTTGRISVGRGMGRRSFDLSDAPLTTIIVLVCGLAFLLLTITYNALLLNALTRYLQTPSPYRRFWTWHPNAGRPLVEIRGDVLLYAVLTLIILLSGHVWELLLTFAGAPLDDPRRPYSGLRLNWFTGYPGTWVAGAITASLFAVYAYVRGWWNIKM